MRSQTPDLLLEEVFRGEPPPGSMPLVDVPRQESTPEDGGFDWRPTILIVAIGALAVLSALYLV